MAEKTPPKRPRRKPTASTAYLKLLPAERRRLLEQLMFGGGRVHRFTQDTPVLPDVWLHFAGALDDDEALPGDPRRGGSRRSVSGAPLLITPFRDTPVGDLRKALRARLGPERGAGVAGLRPRCHDAGAPGLQPDHGRREPLLRRPDPRGAADDRVGGTSSRRAGKSPACDEPRW